MKKYIFSLISLLILLNTTNAWYKEIQIPTRVTNQAKKYLFADVYYIDSTTAKPVILIQTPYNKNYYRYTNLLPPESGGNSIITDTVNYNYVVLDWRGFYANKDKDSTLYDRGLDGYDVVEWIAQQQWCNGKVGTWGASALGLIQFQTAKHHPPHLVCSVPLVKDFKTKYDDYFYGGDYRKEHVESLETLGFISTSLILAHPDEDIYWNTAEKITDIADSIAVPMLLIGGWFDHFPTSVIRAFEDLKTKSDIFVRNKHKLIFGPWLHSGVDELQQGILQYPEAVGIASAGFNKFFDYYLRDIQNNWEQEPVIKYFEMGTNKWYVADDWNSIPRTNDTLYFNSNKHLENSISDINAFDSVIYNPLNPSPAIGGSRFNPFDRTIPMGPQNIKDTIESRSDCLVYSKPVLDNDLVVNGNISVNLLVSSNCKDTDFGVRLCDVNPEGSSIIITQAIRRMRFRNSYSTEDLMLPGQQYNVTIGLEALSMVFLKGHQLRIDITNSDYPMYDINLNNGGQLYKSGDTVIATNYIYYGSQSNVIIPKPVVTTVEEIQNKSENKEIINIFPNPATDFIEFYSTYKTAQEINIYNLLGTKVISANAENNYTHINISALPIGIYVLRIGEDTSLFVKI